MVHDEYLNEMVEIVELSEKVLRSRGAGSKTLTYSVDVGTVPSLFYVDMKCRTSAIRRRAINLLLSYPRREGTWDSILTGKMANCVRVIEEDCIKDNEIPV